MFEIVIRGTEGVADDRAAVERKVAVLCEELGPMGFPCSAVARWEDDGETETSGSVDGDLTVHPAFLFPTVEIAEKTVGGMESVSFLRALREHEEVVGSGRVGVVKALSGRIDELVEADGE